MDNDALVEFSKELRHVRNYVKLEKMRFGGRLRVKYDIQCRDFLIPTLTLQPLVENAIRHGISPKPGGGRVSIHTERRSGQIVIIVEDDGVGFDTSAALDDGHVGILNIKKRLSYLCCADTQLESSPQQGTRVVITISDAARGKNA